MNRAIRARRRRKALEDRILQRLELHLAERERQRLEDAYAQLPSPDEFASRMRMRLWGMAPHELDDMDEDAEDD